jgi:hypothetical protein
MKNKKNVVSIDDYNKSLNSIDKYICDLLLSEISKNLKKVENLESKIWHGSPVWFIDGNPILSYSKQKLGIKLMFFSGADFKDKKLVPGSGKFKDAGIFYNNTKEIVKKDLKDWLAKSVKIQWDYKNIVKRKGKLVKIK